MLNTKIKEFIEILQKTQEVGCILVEEKVRDLLVKTLAESGLVTTVADHSDRLPCRLIHPKSQLKEILKPMLLIATEQDYSAFPAWAKSVRMQVAYFINVEG